MTMPIFLAAALLTECFTNASDSAFSIEWTFGRAERMQFDISTERGEKSFRVEMNFAKANLRDYIDYSTEAWKNRNVKGFKGPARTPVANARLNVRYCWHGKGYGSTFTYDLLPPFHDGRGLYEKDYVIAHSNEWMKTWGNLAERRHRYEFRYEREKNDTTLWLDGQYAGRLKGAGRVKGIAVRHGTAAKVSAAGLSGAGAAKVSAAGLSGAGAAKVSAGGLSGAGAAKVSAGSLSGAGAAKFSAGSLSGAGAATRPASGVSLPPLEPSRANALLMKGAKLNLDAKLPLRVFDPAESLDLGCHERTTKRRDLGWDPMMCRHAFSTGPNYMGYSVPNAKYRTAYVLCAEIPQANRVPVLGTHLTRYGNHGASSIAFDKTELTPENIATNKNIRKVGSLAFRGEKNRRVETPLYLVRHRLDFGKIASLIEDKATFGKDGKSRMNRMNWPIDDYLDFEFVGTGAWAKERSSLQVFGCTLVAADYSFDFVQTERGNIFANDEKPVTCVDIVADRDGAKGAFEYDICECDFAPVAHRRVEFALAKKGERKRFEIPLAQAELGWYGLDFTFFDAAGEKLATHEAAFALLGKDTREAGFESPYACWPHANGGHGNNPDRREVIKLMRKAGYHTGWYDDFPVSNETEIADYPITLSMWGIGNSDRRSDAETVKRRLDRRVAAFREVRRRFPHVQMLQLLHEQGGRDISKEMYFTPAVRGEYKGIDGDWETYWCTEAAKRFKAEFPDMPIMIGNGSSSCEKIASLCRNGFDLNLIDYLGIESKGFQTMPELDTNREAPGMLWTLKATAKRFGFDKPVSACNEYVFRPERMVTPQTGMWRDGVRYDYMFVTDFTIRDYLLSLAHGCKCISTGHLEDSVGTYYDTNWGAGGQCKAYPHSYPKRMFVALATFTKVFDKAVFSRRLATDGNTTYALEFRRNRRQPDYAYAFWTPLYGVDAKVRFPKGAKVRLCDWQGRTGDLADAPDGSGIRFDATPTYLIASKPIASVEIVRHWQRDITGKATPVARFAAGSFDPKLGYVGNGTLFGMERGVFELKAAKDRVMGDYAEFALDAHPKKPAMKWLGGKNWVALTNIPEVVKEFGVFTLKKPIELDLTNGKDYGLWVKGNSSFAQLALFGKGGGGERLQEIPVGKVMFEGWHLMRFRPSARWHNAPVEGVKKIVVTQVAVGSARQSLDPIEMRPIASQLGLGGFVTIDRGDNAKGDDRFKAIMKTVNDKDL